jgi:hypothetical protein
MKKTIYGISVLVIFTVLIMGIDNWFGPEVKSFCSILFFVWIAQVLTGNWKEIIEFLKVLYGLDKK